MVEHLTADQEVPGSTPGAPFRWDFSREKYEEHSSVFDPLCTDGRSLNFNSQDAEHSTERFLLKSIAVPVTRQRHNAQCLALVAVVLINEEAAGDLVCVPN